MVLCLETFHPKMYRKTITLEKEVFVINSPFFCNRVFTLIFATSRSGNSIISFHAFVLQFNFQYIEYWSNNHPLLPQISTVIFPQNSVITKQIQLAPLVPITKEQTTIKRSNEHFYYILIIFQLPVHAQPSGTILATGVSREPRPATLQYKLMGKTFH